MKHKTTRITLTAIVALLIVTSLPLIALAQDSTAEMPASPSSDQMAPMTQCYQAMASMQEQMMARHHAMSARLDQMLADVQKAQGDEKVAAMQALLGELVEQTKSMHMMAMHGPMMRGMDMHRMGMMGGHGMMKQNCPMGSNCPMMKGTTPNAPETEAPAQPEN